jgi:hypothetical protein
MKHRFLFGVLVTLLGLGCHKSSISVTKADAGTLDLFSPADLRGPEDGSLVRSDSGDTIPGADVLSLGPDTILVARDTGTGVADSADVKDLRPAGETPSSPDGTGNLPRDSLAAAELPRSSDALGDGPPSPPAPESPDAKSKSADGEGDLGTDTQPLPKDVTVYANKDLATADDRCVAATPGWVSVVATFLAEDDLRAPDEPAAHWRIWNAGLQLCDRELLELPDTVQLPDLSCAHVGLLQRRPLRVQAAVAHAIHHLCVVCRR